ncbi:hypothetical protein [Bradyrhizobium roseum]|uniref:hypothetical protein n=1 Tax=Bradyrhizobium roseum TaxID=3056648 RepID=UPI00263549AC|nr:hypothetical protein [Bradyrhizobium roseus]WKA30320.1 hypothetical protein QUH67_09195 [Bradyrhizobium roseus]
MPYSIFARDGTSRIVLKRTSREAAEKKARELAELGWFEVQIAEEALMEEAPRAANRFCTGDADGAARL